MKLGGVGKVDQAIADFVLRGDPESEQALKATGVKGLRRMLDLWFKKAKAPADGPIPKLTTRRLAEQWSAALRVLATAEPDAFLAWRIQGITATAW